MTGPKNEFNLISKGCSSSVTKNPGLNPSKNTTFYEFYEELDSRTVYTAVSEMSLYYYRMVLTSFSASY